MFAAAADLLALSAVLVPLFTLFVLFVFLCAILAVNGNVKYTNDLLRHIAWLIGKQTQGPVPPLPEKPMNLFLVLVLIALAGICVLVFIGKASQ